MPVLAKLPVPGPVEYRGSIENPNIPISAATIGDLWGDGAATASGQSVSEQKSLTIPAFWAGVRLLSNDIAALPLGVFRRTEADGREPDRDHRVWPILHIEPNEDVTAFVWVQVSMGHLLTWGNAYSEIVRDGAGRVRELRTIEPDRVEVKRVNGRILYRVTMKDGGQQTITAPNMLHVPALGWNGLVGYSPVRTHRETLGLSLAQSDYGSRFFSNDSRPSAALIHPGKLSPSGVKNLRDMWEQQHRGSANAHKVAVLGEGVQYEQTGIPPEDAQYLEMMKFSVTEVARIIGVPPHKIGDLEHATFSNIEHEEIAYVRHSIVPWARRIEQEFDRKLFMDAERRTHFTKFNLNSLLRGDTLSRFEAYRIAREGGWMSANDILRKEDENPIPDGDTYLVPLNMTPADKIGEEQEDEGRSVERRASTRSLSTRRATLEAFEPLLRDIAGRIVRRETSAARRELQARESLDAWAEEFYAGHREWMVRTLLPVLLAYMRQITAAVADETGTDLALTQDLERQVDEYAEALAKRYSASSTNQLRQLAGDAGTDDVFRDLIGERLDGWTETRAAKLARDEVVRMAGAFAKFAYVAAGITVLRWVTFGDNCPFCDRLDGNEVRTTDNFVDGGTVMSGGDERHDLEIRRPVSHPPLHQGCDCMIVAGG